MVEQTKVDAASQGEKYYATPSITVDAIVTKKNDNAHDILLITRGRDPFKGFYAFPGGFVDYGEDPPNACIRELKEECCVDGVQPELICVAGEPNRDPRKHVISIVYSVMVDQNAQVAAGDDAATAKWYDLKTIMGDEKTYPFAFDHKKILNTFLEKKLPQYLNKQ